MTRSSTRRVLSILVVFAVGTLSWDFGRALFVSKQVEKVRVYMPIQAKMPDPANIQNTGQWYLLGHISSGLSRFDHVNGRFEPLLADYEAYSSGVHSFTVKENAKFSDGSPITAGDVVSSIKRLLIRRSSTHFPLWDYLEGCGTVKRISDECTGLKAVSHRRIEIRLQKPAESFLLQMSSPETGIWSESDIDAETLEIRPTKFSGPYRLETVDSSGFVLTRNPLNPISISFPDSPQSIEIRALKPEEVSTELERGGLDLVIRSHNPYDPAPIGKLGFEAFRSAPATWLFLHATGRSSKKLIPREFLEVLWRRNTDTGIIPSDNFLPFDPGLSLTRAEFLAELPEQSKLTKKTIRIGVPWTYLSEGFYEFLRRSAAEVGFPIELVKLTRDEWLKGLEDGSEPRSVDFILGLYATSERYPAVQLRFITGPVRGPRIDLTAAETPELSAEKKEVLRSYQKALLHEQYAIPLFLARHQILYRKSLSVGDQPPSDAEVELWRVVQQ